jgi:hypothetical protein
VWTPETGAVMKPVHLSGKLPAGSAAADDPDLQVKSTVGSIDVVA